MDYIVSFEQLMALAINSSHIFSLAEVSSLVFAFSLPSLDGRGLRGG
jgi:hypothetical protein